MDTDKNILDHVRSQSPAKDGSEWLDGKLLIATPAMADTRFERAVIFMCAHDEKGAMGLIVNKTVPDLSMAKLLKDLVIPMTDEDAMNKVPVFVGGPVETQRGFLLHSNEFNAPETIKIKNDLCVTGTVEALREAMSEDGPAEKLFALGYAGWSAGQLEQELQENAWLVCDAHHDLIFTDEQNGKWERALGHLGIDPLLLSATQGHA